MLTDYSSVVFDGINMGLPSFLYVPDYEDYVTERGDLMWNLDELPAIVATTARELSVKIESFELGKYKMEIEKFRKHIQLEENGNASKKIADHIEKIMNSSVGR